MTPLTGELDGRTAVVTGANSGIGLGIAEAMAGAGACVLIVARNAERLQATAHTIAAAGGDCHYLQQDLTDTGAAAKIVEAAVDRFGSLDILVHAAGIFEPHRFESCSLDSLDRQWNVNFRAAFALTQEALPLLRSGGVVIFISSIAGHVGFPNASAYCATKGAIEALTRALAVELAEEGVRVNAIAPGNVRTPINDHLLKEDEYMKAMLDATPARRIGRVKEIAPLAVFLASEAAQFMYGSSVLVDGGWTAQ